MEANQAKENPQCKERDEVELSNDEIGDEIGVFLVLLQLQVLILWIEQWKTPKGKEK